MLDLFTSLPSIFTSLFIYIVLTSSESLSFSTASRNKPLSPASISFDPHFIPNRPHHRHRRRICCHFLLVSQLLQSQHPSLNPTSSFLKPPSLLPLPHEYIHLPTITIGPSFETFDDDSLPFVHMLKTFQLMLPVDTIPTCSFRTTNGHEYLQATGPAYTLSHYT